MAEYVLCVVGAILDKILPLAADEISRLWGVNEDLRKLAGKLEMMQALISDAQSKPITSKVMQLWLKRLQSIAGDAEIVMDDFEYEVLRQKVEKRKRKRDMVRELFTPHSSNPALNHVEMANKIKDIISSLEDVYKEANQFGLQPAQLLSQIGHHPAQINEDRLTDPFVVESEILGREDDVYQVVSMLISSDYKKDLPVISVMGMAGQGKTTLAQVVFKDDRVVKYFEKRIWVCVSDDFKVERLLNEMLQSLGGTSAETTNREGLVRKLRESLERKRYLLVLDDVWNENREKWDCMRKCLVAIGGSQGSKILATTRSDHVASAIQTSCPYRLRVLSDDDSWMLFKKLAFADGGARKTRDLVDIGRRILKRCGGMPLAIKAIGGLLNSMKEQSEWLMIDKSKQWNHISSIGDAVFSTLKLSYDHLPSFSVKQCFASCSIFPKDTRMKKEELIQIWIAQGLINHSKGGDLEMEEIGSTYFNILLRSCLLQDPQRDIYNDIISCKMHDLVHDLSSQVSNNGFFNTEDDTIKNHANEVRHLTLLSSQGKVLKNMEGIPPNLQKLYLVGDHAVLENIFKMCRYLYILIVECWVATDLPGAVGDMKHLRYLDIVRTGITTMPDSITKLYKLMTLRVGKLRVIPHGFGNLINLRHFYIAEAPLMLPGIGQLANLRTLSYFMVGQEEGCQIEELGHLPCLKGELNIFGLEKLSSKESAAEANLSGKSNIQRLRLQWEDERKDCGKDVIDVMEGLQPHSNLKSLTIEGFKGSKLPWWMVVLDNLVEIRLENLAKCEEVPSFGHLPYLQILEVVSLPNVKRIGREFYGLETLDYPSCSRERQAVTSFPSLKELTLGIMHDLVEWSDAKIPTASSSWIKVLPKLQKLHIRMLLELAILPNFENFTCLEELSMLNCRSLTCIRNLNRLKSLRSLWIAGCPNLDATLDINNLSSLHLEGCDKLISSLRSLNNSTSLEDLEIFSGAASWPKDLDHPPNLRSLTLDCYSWDLDCFPWPFSVISSMTKDAATAAVMKRQHFISLETLDLVGGPKITSLPEQIQHLPALRNLTISDFGGLEALPDWLGCLQNLESLSVNSCFNLKQLPSVEAMQHLTNLRQLYILRSPHLRDSHWPKDTRLPPVHILL